ncbi:hypothetical protein NEOLEDRAFT_462092 [Neolentinus lepideus HHB14362 ss-1]|uniref:C2H2-type domain-containing protein n=1 Tax=Neolentinus lepideus HHB14362 ss-1 TaxID=1314782 RepID=A0A165VGZ9_9AGAM|nr:hypothetical protein NEOLEDRAFT_462092 [Neolentinus lepideus HHB14362 ss-1]
MEGTRDNHEEKEDNDENEDWDDDEEYSDDGLDAEAEAEAIARRLQEQLWADIAKAQADAAAASAITTTNDPIAARSTGTPIPIATESSRSRKQQAALLTMKTIIECAHKDLMFRSTLSSTCVPDRGDVFSLLTRSVADGAVAEGLAKPLAQLMVTLARSESLFSSIKNSDASVIELERRKNKRKREVATEINTSPSQKRSYYTPDCAYLNTQVQDAVRTITDALSSHMPANPSPVDSSLIASMQVQLHQVFLFAVTSSSDREARVLQEIGGLIQVLGVLSGIQIGQQPQPDVAPLPGTPSQSPDIGTAVYRCLVPSCGKTFIRLYSLRAHQRFHAQGDRPYQCAACSANFARNHDLKRHAKLHESKAYKCLGCDKIFSRRDAIKRHKNSARGKEKNMACIDADVIDVDLGDTKTPRMYSYPSMNTGQLQNGSDLAGVFEDGQVSADIVAELQAAVIRLHPLLQEYVTKALGTQHAQPPSTSTEATTGQGQNTLASVIARVQQETSAPADLQPQTAQASPALDLNVSAAAEAASLAMYGLSEEQTRLLEQAIANAATLAQVQAEAEAMLEEEDDEEYESEESHG